MAERGPAPRISLLRVEPRATAHTTGSSRHRSDAGDLPGHAGGEIVGPDTPAVFLAATLVMMETIVEYARDVVEQGQ